MTDHRKYRFSWEDTIGVNLDEARPSLGPSLRLEAYRLFQFTLRDVLEARWGTATADDLFREAGIMAGKEFYQRFCSQATTLNELVRMSAQALADLGMGILRIEDANIDTMSFIFTVTEDLDCSGMPDTGDAICVYDEGLLQGILEAFSGKRFNVREVDCWSTGGRVCRFEAKYDAHTAPGESPAA